MVRNPGEVIAQSDGTISIKIDFVRYQLDSFAGPQNPYVDVSSAE